MEKWYQKTGVIIALLIFFFPVGLYLMWKYTDWNKIAKAAITAVLIAVCIFSVSNGNSDAPAAQEESKVEKEETTEKDDSEQKEAMETVMEETQEEKTEDVIVTDILSKPDFTAERNTTEMVDQIGFTARKYYEDMTDEQEDQIIEYIKSADHNYYDSNDDMEKFMWYGYSLDYKYDDGDPRSELGTDLVQAIKYVYRGVEKVEDDSTQENLLQIDKSLAAIYPEEAAVEEPEESAPEETEEAVQETPAEEIVYLPEEGEKYHSKKDCSGMENPRQVTISEAKAMGYEPCKRCH